MSKHTPGPWLIQGRIVYALMSDGWRHGKEQFKNRFTIFVQPDRECNDDETAANARLIASAPELLEALKETLLFCENFSNRWDGQTGAHPFGMVNRARAAIAKAEGTE